MSATLGRSWLDHWFQDSLISWDILGHKRVAENVGNELEWALSWLTGKNKRAHAQWPDDDIFYSVELFLDEAIRRL